MTRPELRKKKAVTEVALIFGDMHGAVFDDLYPMSESEQERRDLIAALLTLAAVHRLNVMD